MDSLVDYSLKDYITVLGDKIPAPGGGSAAAAVLCCGITLYRKCLLYSSDNFEKDDFENIELSLNQAVEKALTLVDRDREVYLKLNDLIKDKPADKDEIQKAYRDAASVPLEIVRIAISTLDLIGSSLTKIKKGFLSDVTTAISFLEAVFNSALIFVETNLESISESFEDFSGFKREDISKIKGDFKRIKKDLRDE